MGSLVSNPVQPHTLQAPDPSSHILSHRLPQLQPHWPPLHETKLRSDSGSFLNPDLLALCRPHSRPHEPYPASVCQTVNHTNTLPVRDTQPNAVLLPESHAEHVSG